MSAFEINNLRTKPPKGALVKSHGIERLGIAKQSRTPVIIFVSKIYTKQVLIEEMNESEPLKRCREVVIFCQKSQSMLCDESTNVTRIVFVALMRGLRE